MSKSFEHKFIDAKKDQDGFSKIKVRFYLDDNDFYACVMAKPVDITPAYLSKFMIQEELNLGEALQEIRRLNLTIWEFKNISEIEVIIGDISGRFECYFNGAEVSWKFYEAVCPIIKNAISEEDIQTLSQEIPWFEPHNDDTGNFGDQEVHAVYTL